VPTPIANSIVCVPSLTTPTSTTTLLICPPPAQTVSFLFFALMIKSKFCPSYFADDAIVNKDVEVRRKRSRADVTFVPGSSPPKVKSLLQESYLYGRLYVGDVILSVNDEVLFYFINRVCKNINSPFFYFRLSKPMKTSTGSSTCQAGNHGS
jgi:hypothetical protein